MIYIVAVAVYGIAPIGFEDTAIEGEVRHCRIIYEMHTDKFDLILLE